MVSMASRAAWLGVLAVSVAPLCPAHTFANPAPSASASAAAPTVNDAELGPLPVLTPLKRGEPSADSVSELGGLLARLTSQKADIRDAARKDLEQPRPEWVAAARARAHELSESFDRDRTPKILDDARKAARKERRAEGKDKSKDKKPKTDGDDEDWLTIVHRSAQPKEERWRELVELLAITRVLAAAGTTPAILELVELRGRKFGEMMRIDLGRQLERLKEKAVPALLIASKHDASVVRTFASQKLDQLGKVTPGEAVSVTDPDVLADTLRAFGMIREVEAVDVLLSFANHDRKKVRDAAREAIAAIGEPGRWRLRDAYQDLTGEKVDKSVPWDLLAKRIFKIYDNARVAELWELFSSGVAASQAGKLPDATSAFDKVLARDPLFERRKEMAPAYLEHAKTIGFERAEDRLAMLRKARRLSPEGDGTNKIEAEIAFTEAKILIAEGRPERYLLERAFELDPAHVEAKALLDDFERKAVADAPPPPSRKFTTAGIIAAVTTLLTGLALFLRKKSPPGPPSRPKAEEPGEVTEPQSP